MAEIKINLSQRSEDVKKIIFFSLQLSALSGEENFIKKY